MVNTFTKYQIALACSQDICRFIFNTHFLVRHTTSPIYTIAQRPLVRDTGINDVIYSSGFHLQRDRYLHSFASKLDRKKMCVLFAF